MRLFVMRGGVIAAGLSVMLMAWTVWAADHSEAPGAAADPAADIADYYAWHQGTGVDQRLVLVLTSSGFTAPALNPTGTYDRDVLYGMHIDTDADNLPDHSIWVRFAQDSAGDWGMQVTGIPGEEAISGPVEMALDGVAGARAWAGISDDPFFFDAAGFNMTLDTGVLSFDATDGVAGLNVTAIVVELPTDALGTNIQTWAETRRISE
ncbi:MAG: hypothetical protein ACI9WU_005533 [Myxococcota bacterium]|jgi:hypothetical protein